MPEVILVCVGKMKEKFYIDAFAEYSKRLASFCKFRLIEINEEHLPDSPSASEISKALDKESRKILDSIPSGTYIISMCIEGKEYSSTELSKMISDLFISGWSRIAFIVGGSFGLSDNVKNCSSCKMSMSRMTFPHHLARVMLAEQIYRSFQINLGSAYHK